MTQTGDKMKIKKADLSRGMWLFLGGKIFEGHSGTYLEERIKLFDYRRTALCARELLWYSQQRNPFTIQPSQITKMSPLTCRFKGKSDYYTHPFMLREVTHVFETHTDFISWRNQFLKDERDQIRELHNKIRDDKTYWSKRAEELRHWNRLDDLKRIRKL
ncbi:MAG: hypothetical protein CMB80_12565 [Flammeovirgaceae bacterium]|jgi:hypothetical protein|nr:hypothetical protein [Flammeovirgaceae bacterium]|tara:strand:- start:222 stop:701 length:480 start_codon:yes stop_codon:yes gene_type:complete